MIFLKKRIINIILLILLLLGIYQILFYIYDYNNYRIYDTDKGALLSQIHNIVFDGKFFSCYLNMHYLREHFSVLKIFAAPTYIFFQSAVSIDIFLFIIYISSAYAFYIYLKSKFDFNISLFAVLIYLFNPYLNNNLFISDEAAYSIFLIFLYFNGLKTKNNKLIIFSLIIFVFLKETNFILAALLALYAFLFTENKKNGLILFIFSAAGFYLVVYHIMPVFGAECDKLGSIFGGFYQYDRWAIIHQPLDLLNKIFNADRLFFLSALFLPLLFIPLFSFKKIIIVLLFYIMFAVSDRDSAFNYNVYYFLPVLPVLFVAFSDVIEKIKNKESIKILLLFILIFNLFILSHNKLNHYDYRQDLFSFENKSEFEKVLNMISDNSSIMSSSRFHAYISNRSTVRMPHIFNIEEDIILLDFTEKYWFIMAPVEDRKKLELYLMKKLDSLAQRSIYNIKYLTENFVVLEKNKISIENNAYLIYKLKKQFERRTADILGNKFEAIKNKLLDIYYPENENYLVYHFKDKRIIGDLMITPYSFTSELKISNISLRNDSQVFNINNINNNFFDLSDIQFPDTFLSYGINEIFCDAIFNNGNLQTIKISLMFDNKPPSIELRNNTIYYTDDYLPVEIKIIKKNGVKKYLTSCFIDLNSIFLDKIYNKPGDMGYDLFLHNSLKKSGKINLSLTAKDIQSLKALDFAGNEKILNIGGINE